MTSEPTNPKPPPLDRFLVQLDRDRRRGALRSLEAYAREFPGDLAGLARAYFHAVDVPSSTTPGSGEHIGPYRTLRELGRGGQGVVYLAEDTRLQRRVALKVLSNLGAASEDVLRRFRREALVASRLAHPGICAVFESGQVGDVPYIAMQYVEGETLAVGIAGGCSGDTIAASTLYMDLDADGEAESHENEATVSAGLSRGQIDHVLLLFEKMARALHAAHAAGIVHRDIKPGNIVISKDGQPVILDFGLARADDEDLQTLTRTGDMFGTPAYMSPEQLSLGTTRLDCRTDVYSLGATLYEALTFRRPFEGPTRDALYRNILTKDPADPRTFNRKIPFDLKVVLETAMAKDRDARYQTAEAFAEELSRVRRHEPIAARPAGVVLRTRRWCERNPLAAVLLIALFAVLAAGLVTSLLALSRAEDNARVATEAQRRAESEAAIARRRLLEYEQMSDASLARRLLIDDERLWPQRSWRVAAMDKWLDEATGVTDRMGLHREARDRLRLRARATLTEDERALNQTLREERWPEFFAEVHRKMVWADDTQYWLDRVKANLSESEAAGPSPSDAEAERRESLRAAIAHDTNSLAQLRGQVALLQADPRFSERRVWPFDDARDAWRHEVLSELVTNLEELSPRVEVMRARRRASAEMPAASIDAHEEQWATCLADLKVHPLYGANKNLTEEGRDALMNLKPQEGLVPLGRDAGSTLWEFWMPETGPMPPYESKGPLVGRVNLETVRGDGAFGLVLVLIPGGTHLVGTKPETNARRYDPFAGQHGDLIGASPNGDARLDPYFISKFEVTQAQWVRLGFPNESDHQAWEKCQHDAGPAHPVTDVDWNAAVRACRHLGLMLPTEAQWEVAARGGTDTPFWCGREVEDIESERAGNLSDRTAAAAEPAKFHEQVVVLEDDHVVHAPVGSFEPNPFGLHDTIGNVREWCADLFGGYYVPPRPGDGLRQPDGDIRRCVRGGSFLSLAWPARSAYRGAELPSYGGEETGFRPARPLSLP